MFDSDTPINFNYTKFFQKSTGIHNASIKYFFAWKGIHVQAGILKQAVMQELVLDMDQQATRLTAKVTEKCAFLLWDGAHVLRDAECLELCGRRRYLQQDQYFLSPFLPWGHSITNTEVNCP